MQQIIKPWRIGAALLLLIALGVAVLPGGRAAGTEDSEPRYAYVPSIAEGTISAINLSTHTVDWTLQVSQGTEERAAESAMGIAADPDGRFVYTGDVVTKEVVIVDAEAREIVKRIPLPHGVHAIDLSPDGAWLWVTGGLESFPWLSATSVIDTRTLEIARTLSPALGSGAHWAFTPDGREIWAASVTTNLAWVTDTASGQVLAAVPLTRGTLAGASPEAEKGLIGFNEIAVSPNGKTAYAVGPEAAIVYAIDVASRGVIGTAQAGERAHGIAVSRDGREVWTADRGGTVTVINAETLRVIDTLDMGEYANHIAFGLDGRYAYVTRLEDMVMIDVGTRQIIREIPLGKEPHEISLEDFYAR
jgi:DNA-binding beta-propeller fold protein YncE